MTPTGAIVFAFLGGMILNVMPCVLPILLLKMMRFLTHRKARLSHARLSFGAMALGIVAGMGGFATIVIGARTLGYTFGWGVHFQNPIFVVLLLMGMVVCATMVWGWIDIRVPKWLSHRISRFSDMDGILGDFGMGVGVMILATPCTAPFLGAAVGFAMTQSTWMIAIIFVSIGLGLAFPYFLFAAFPQWISILPPPGSWMEMLKSLFGFGFLATAIWLRYVLSYQVHPVGIFLVDFGVLALALGLWLSRHLTRMWVGMLAASVVVGLVIGVTYAFQLGSVSQSDEIGAIGWQDFGPSVLDTWIGQGDTVFVSVSAEWCVTCKANERLVLGTSAFSRLAQKYGVRLMKADYTNPDDRIARFLESHERYGVPAYVVYGPSAKKGIVLSEILTLRHIEEVLKLAIGR